MSQLLHDRTQSRNLETIYLALAWCLPTVYTWLYFVSWAGTSAGQWAYSVGKIVQFALPALWWLVIARYLPNSAESSEPHWRIWFNRRDLTWGVTVGAAIAIAIFLLYTLWLQHSPVLDQLRPTVHQKLSQFSINSPAAFLILALFYSLFHSLMEEYYWRAFVYGHLRHLIGVLPSAIVSSIGFMAHHVIVVGVYFAPHWEQVAFFSLSVAVGGVIWAWLYQRSNSLLCIWVSHGLVDAALMTIGYLLAFA